MPIPVSGRPLLEYNGDPYGTHVVRVEPAGTTKECSECGVATSKPLWVREPSCPAYGYEEDRDLNAVKTVLSRGMTQIGAGRSESTPVRAVIPCVYLGSDGLHVKQVVEAGSPAVKPRGVFRIARPVRPRSWLRQVPPGRSSARTPRRPGTVASTPRRSSLRPARRPHGAAASRQAGRRYP